MMPRWPLISLLVLALLALLAGCGNDPPPPLATNGATDSAAYEQQVSDQPAEDVPPATAPPGTAMPPDAVMPGTAEGEAPGADATAGEAAFYGYGHARFGMSEAQVRQAWAGELGPVPAANEACFHLVPAGQAVPSDFALMFEDGRFVRYSVASDALTAPGGGRRGMTIADIERLYPGRIQERPHKYVDGGRYLRIKAEEGEGVLVFATDAAGVVTEWRVGLPPQVDYVEGCS